MHGKGRAVYTILLVVHTILIALGGRHVRFRLGSYSFVENSTGTYVFEERARWSAWGDVPLPVLHVMLAVAAGATQLYPYDIWLLAGVAVNKTLAAWTLAASLGVQDAAAWLASAAAACAFAASLRALEDVTGVPSVKRGVLQRTMTTVAFVQAAQVALLASRAADAWSALASASETAHAGAVLCAYVLRVRKLVPPTALVCFTVTAQAVAVGWWSARPRGSPEAVFALMAGVCAAACATLVAFSAKSDAKKAYDLPYASRPEPAPEDRYGYEAPADDREGATKTKKKKKNSLQEKLMAANLVPVKADAGLEAPPQRHGDAASKPGRSGRVRDDGVGERAYGGYGGQREERDGGSLSLESTRPASDAYSKRGGRPNMTFLI